MFSKKFDRNVHNNNLGLHFLKYLAYFICKNEIFFASNFSNLKNLPVREGNIILYSYDLSKLFHIHVEMREDKFLKILSIRFMQKLNTSE